MSGVMLTALTLAIAAIVVPPARTTEWMVGGLPSATMADVELGVWILKGTLLLHATMLVIAARARLPWTAPAALVERGLEAPRRITAREAIVLGAILVVAAVLRLYALGEGMWFDEIQTLIESVRRPTGHMLATFLNSNQHTFFSVLAKATVSLLGESAWTLRLPAVLLGIASLVALYWFGTLVASRLEAMLATALMTVAYHHVWFSQNARGYTGLLLCTLLGTGLFLRMLAARETRSWGLAVAYAVSMALAIYTHLTAALVVGAHGLVWLALVVQRRRAGIWPVAWTPVVGLVLSGTFALSLYSVGLPQVVRAMRAPVMPGMDTAWKTPGWALAEMVGGLTHGSPIVLAVLVAGMIVGIAGVVSYGRRHWSIPALMLLPALITAVALVAKGHNLWPRFFFFSAGFAILIAIRGAYALAPVLRTRRAPALATAGVLLVIAASAATVPRAWGPKQDYEGARRFVEKERASDDAVVMVDMMVLPYQHFYGVSMDSVTNGAQLAAIDERHPRTWVLYQFPVRLAAVQPTTWARLQERYREAAEFPGTLGGGSIFVMVNR